MKRITCKSKVSWKRPDIAVKHPLRSGWGPMPWLNASTGEQPGGCAKLRHTGSGQWPLILGHHSSIIEQIQNIARRCTRSKARTKRNLAFSWSCDKRQKRGDASIRSLTLAGCLRWWQKTTHNFWCQGDTSDIFDVWPPRSFALAQCGGINAHMVVKCIQVQHLMCRTNVAG